MTGIRGVPLLRGGIGRGFRANFEMRLLHLGLVWFVCLFVGAIPFWYVGVITGWGILSVSPFSSVSDLWLPIGISCGGFFQSIGVQT